MLNKAIFSRHLEEDEVLMRVVHKHWLIGLKVLFWPTLFLAACLGGLWLTISSRGVFLTLSLATMVVMVWWLRNFFDYYLDAWIITDQGIIDIAWHGWFHREASKILYSDVNGVSYEIKGVIPTLMRFGTITVEKVSTGAAVSLDYVKSPRRVEMLVLQMMEAYLHHKNLKDASQVQELLSVLIAEQINRKTLVSEDEE